MAFPTQHISLPKVAVRFVLVMLILLALNHAYAQRLIDALLPFFRWEIAQLDDTYRVLDLSLSQQGADTVLRLDVGIARDIVIGGRALPADPRARADVSTLAGHLTQPGMLVLALLLAWPARRASEYPLRVVLAGAGIALVIMIDVPFVLWAEVWDIHVSALKPGRFSPLLIWRDFLQGGGRFVLGLAVGVLALAAGQRLTARIR